MIWNWITNYEENNTHNFSPIDDGTLPAKDDRSNIIEMDYD